ncbi:MAG: radical SAM protein [Prevotellaceae bacterium]|nr:radical SAM protein [Prevotellaceae bacterium]
MQNKTTYDELLYLVTYRCDRKCSFCFNEIFDNKIDKSLNENRDVNRIVEFIRDLGIKKVYISGGEPSMRDDIFSIVSGLSMVANVVIFTNGLLFNRFTVELIAKQSLSAINISLQKGDILMNTEYFQKLLHLVGKLRNINNKIKLNAQVMLDGDYFSLKNSYGLKTANTCFDRLFWQPLTLRPDMIGYSNTLEGMDKMVSNQILSDLKSLSEGEYQKHIDTIQMYLNKEIMPLCRMGYNYLVLNPDMQTVRCCPHLNLPVFSISDALQRPSVKHTSDCLSMACICLYSHLLRRYKD